MSFLRLSIWLWIPSHLALLASIWLCKVGSLFFKPFNVVSRLLIILGALVIRFWYLALSLSNPCFSALASFNCFWRSAILASTIGICWLIWLILEGALAASCCVLVMLSWTVLIWLFKSSICPWRPFVALWQFPNWFSRSLSLSEFGLLDFYNYVLLVIRLSLASLRPFKAGVKALILELAYEILSCLSLIAFWILVLLLARS